jgi:hypothetical protein
VAGLPSTKVVGFLNPMKDDLDLKALTYLASPEKTERCKMDKLIIPLRQFMNAIISYHTTTASWPRSSGVGKRSDRD